MTHRPAATPWLSTAPLLAAIGVCRNCPSDAVWTLLSDGDALSFCRACVCRWVHPRGPYDPTDPFQACPACAPTNPRMEACAGSDR